MAPSETHTEHDHASVQRAHDHQHEDHDHHHGTGWWDRARHALTPHSHDHAGSIQSADEASREGIRTAWISLVGMGLTAVLQLVVVALSGSMALLADTVHNLGHLVTTIPLIIAFRLGRRAPTRRYTYGLKRAEDLVGLLIGLVIAASAALIIWESVRALSQPRELTHLGWVLAAALIGALGNEAVAIYRIRTGRRIGSAALIAEGQHARTDALTSLAVIIGVVGAWSGLPQLDAVVGLVIAAVIIAVLVASMRTVVRRLMDGVEPDTLQRIETVAAAVPGVVAVEGCRARWLGHRLETDLDIRVDAALSVSAGHDIAREVHGALRSTVPHLDRATIHVHPATDQDPPPQPYAVAHPGAEASGRHTDGRSDQESRSPATDSATIVDAMSITFESQVEAIGERLIVRLPAAASAELPSRGQVAVEAQINGHAFVTVVEPDGRKGHWIAVDEQLREAASLDDGAPVTGELTPTKAWPEPAVPEDLSAALAEATDLDDTWSDITPMARWEWVRWVNATKNPQTRERRVEVSIDKLRGGKRRPCCFDLSSCTDPEVAKSGKLIEAP